jgi:hypothetical protein
MVCRVVALEKISVSRSDPFMSTLLNVQTFLKMIVDMMCTCEV